MAGDTTPTFPQGQLDPQPSNLNDLARQALQMYNHDYGSNVAFTSNWSSVGTIFETFVNKYLFPKITATYMSNQNLGNRFDFLAKEVDFIGQFMEEYVILDAVPVDMNLTKSEELMLKRAYPQMATKLYGPGQLKKLKFTLNNNDNRLNWQTMADAVNYAVAVYKQRISMINIDEERRLKAMVVDYWSKNTRVKRTVTDLNDMASKIGTALLNLHNNSDQYNEADKASGGALGRYTTITDLKDVFILTTDEIKAFLLDTRLANTFQLAGLDFTDHIISFDSLGGSFRLTKDVTISDSATIQKFRAMGDYQIALNDYLPAGIVIPWDVSGLSEFKSSVEEIKPSSDLWAAIGDIKALNYNRKTKDMLKPAFYNPETDETNYWIHYYSQMMVSPFYNKMVLTGK